MSESTDDDWATGIEEILIDKENPNDCWIYFISDTVPEYMYEHRQNRYEAENQEKYVDVLAYAEEEV